MQNATASNSTGDNRAVLMDMGFSEEQSKEALSRFENVEDAIAFLLNDQIQPSPPSSPGVSQVDSSEDETSFAANPRSMQFLINTGHPSLSFPNCLLHIVQASFDLYDQIMVHRSHLLSYKTWHNHGEVKQLFECPNGDVLRQLNQEISFAANENQICSALVTDATHNEPTCLALFGVASFLEHYTSPLKRLQTCPSRFFLQQDENDSDTNNTNDSASGASRKQ